LNIFATIKKSLLFLIFIILLFTFSCKKEQKDINDMVVFVPKTLSSIPLLELNGKSIDNIQIKSEIYQDHIMAMAEFMQGKIDIFMTGFTQGVANYYGNKNIVHIATPVWGVSSLVANDPSVKKIEDLIGKKILVPFVKSPLDLQLRAILKKESLMDKIEINYSPIPQAIPMLLTKKTDAICVPEPLASKLIIGKKAFKVFSFSEKWEELYNGEKRSPQVSIFVKKSFADKNEKFLKKLVKEINAEIIKIKSKPGNYALKYSETFKLDKKIIVQGISNTLFEIPEQDISKKICIDYLNEIEYSKEQLNNKFFFKY